MEDANNVGQRIVENAIRVFTDNPLVGVAVILLIIVLLLGIILLIGLICKGKDENIGSGVIKGIIILCVVCCPTIPRILDGDLSGAFGGAISLLGFVIVIWLIVKNWSKLKTIGANPEEDSGYVKVAKVILWTIIVILCIVFVYVALRRLFGFYY